MYQTFNIRIAGGRHEEVLGKPIVIQGFEDFQFFIHRPERGAGPHASQLWKISETSSGYYLIYGCETEWEALAEASALLQVKGKDVFKAAVDEAIARDGLVVQP